MLTRLHSMEDASAIDARHVARGLNDLKQCALDHSGYASEGNVLLKAHRCPVGFVRMRSRGSYRVSMSLVVKLCAWQNEAQYHNVV